MRKYLYTTLLLALLAQGGAMAQDNEGKKSGWQRLYGRDEGTQAEWQRKDSL